MTNAEKYLKDGVDIQDFVDELRHMTQVMEWNGQQCLFICYIKDWLKEQSKPTLSEDEKVILRHRPLDLAYIGRDSFGLYISQFDDRLGSYFYWEFSNAFDSIKIGEEYKISDLLGDE